MHGGDPGKRGSTPGMGFSFRRMKKNIRLSRTKIK
jgi:hypothetical protein